MWPCLWDAHVSRERPPEKRPSTPLMGTPLICSWPTEDYLPESCRLLRSECLGSGGASGTFSLAPMLSSSQTSASHTRTAGLLQAPRFLRALARSKPAARRLLPVYRATVKEFGRLDLLERVYGGERTFAGQLYVRALPGPLQYLPSFLVPGTLALSAVGAAFGPGILEALASYLPAHQVKLNSLFWSLLPPSAWLDQNTLHRGTECMHISIRPMLKL